VVLFTFQRCGDTPPQSIASKDVGDEFDLIAKYGIGPRSNVLVGYTHFWRGNKIFAPADADFVSRSESLLLAAFRELRYPPPRRFLHTRNEAARRNSLATSITDVGVRARTTTSSQSRTLIAETSRRAWDAGSMTIPN
jgi:hypothetical protein